MGLEPLLLGLALGVRHALEPDHLAAITTLVADAKTPRAAAETGAAWGAGHAAAILVFGGALVAFGVRVPAHVAFALDLAVAAMLVGLGIHAVLAHRHDRHEHARPTSRRSTLVGFVHGASGTAAITLLCLTTLRSTSTAIGFLLLFAAGSLVSMAAMSGLLAAPLTAIAKRGPSTLRALRIGGGVLAFAAAVVVAVTAFKST